MAKAANEEQAPRLHALLEDHSAAGIDILYSQPSGLIRAAILVMLLLVVTGLLWSFIGRADIIVSAPGALAPEEDVRRVYAPIEGELVDIYVAEGQPVSKGDVLARLNARDAIRVASEALEAQLQLADAEQEHRLFPQRRALMEKQAETLKAELETQQQLHEKRVTEGLTKLAQAQRAKLEEARGNLDKSAHAKDAAERELAKLQRLYQSPGGGGIAKNKVDEARDAALAADTDNKLAQANLGSLEFQLSEEYAKAKADLERSDQKVAELKISYDKALDDIKREEYKTELKYKSARLAAEAAARIRFDNIDEENFLRILAPVSGIVTHVSFTQAGDKVPASSPLVSIAPAGARTVLKIAINERDRGFLHEGLPVKMKFSAFPYQRYGFITGTLEYISPATQPPEKGAAAVYKGNVGLDKDYFLVKETKYPLRYGMQATAEIAVQQRRLIDFVLDPMREF
jgi:membrane fusion protein, hemolysin D